MTLPTLLELRIASGLTAPDRSQDFADVIQLVRANGLDADFVGQLHPSVRAKYSELWSLAQLPTREF